jgi:hypothetical protein
VQDRRAGRVGEFRFRKNEFAIALDDRALILALDHPIYSIDACHSCSAKITVRW